MSRANVGKAKADKGGKAASAPTPAQVHEIIPGKFNDQDWNFMLEKDDSDDFISDIIEEVCSSALDKIYKDYLEKQLIPFTVCQARDAIVQIIEWQFLAHDPGESNLEQDIGWQEDDEPEPGVTDCWAQGSVPKTIVTPRLPSVQDDIIVEAVEGAEDELTEEAAEEGAVASVGEMPEIAEESAQELMEEAESAPFGGISHERTMITENPPLVDMASGDRVMEPQESKEEKPAIEYSSKEIVKRKASFKPHRGPLKSAGVSKMTESLQMSEERLLREHLDDQAPEYPPSPTMMNMPISCHSIVKLQAGRPPGQRDVVYDVRGNVISLTKIEPDQLPNHQTSLKFAVEKSKYGVRTSTKTAVVDPEVEAAQTRLEAMRKGRYVAGAKPRKSRASQDLGGKQSKAGATPGSRQTRTTGMTGRTGKMSLIDGPISPPPPPLIDTMQVAPGVVVKEGGRVKTGPIMQPKKPDMISSAMSRGLKSIKLNRAQAAAVTVTEILESQAPIVRPIAGHEPIPPIASTQVQ